MTPFVAIILGLVEGLTEFIPVSSSGHLIIARYFLDSTSGGLAFDAIIQLSASLAVIVYFFRDIVDIIITFFRIIRSYIPTKSSLEKIRVDKTRQTMVYAIIFGTIPAIFFGILFEANIEVMFREVYVVALMLVLGSVLMYYAEKIARQNRELSVFRGLVIGFFQCLALVPGVSRSGATISGGLLTGLTQNDAVRFSFLLSLPVLIGAGLKKLYDVRALLGTDGVFGAPLIIGSITAFISGLIAVHFLVTYLRHNKMTVFIWYRVLLAVVLFVTVYFR
jgi:undecaprenyl-diphosphatase